MAPRSMERCPQDVQKAMANHLKRGHDLTDQESDVRDFVLNKVPPFERWYKTDMMLIYEGLQLPDKRLYGFFNLDDNATPVQRLLYLGKSNKSLKNRVTRRHHKYCYALRHGATHVCFMTTNINNPELINQTEIALIQKWGPYLNRAENPFNYVVDPLIY